jgi:voltage-gated potassium channel Kch
VGDQNKGSLLVLDEADNVVETVLDVVGLLGDILLLLALGNSGSLSVETLLLLGLGLRAVLVEELEGLGSGVAVQSVLELSNGRGNLQAKVQDLLLALKTDILGPLDEAGEVALGLDVLANTEVAGAALDERVLSALLGNASLALGVGERGGLLSGLRRLSLRKEDQRVVHQLLYLL